MRSEGQVTQTRAGLTLLCPLGHSGLGDKTWRLALSNDEHRCPWKLRVGSRAGARLLRWKDGLSRTLGRVSAESVWPARFPAAPLAGHTLQGILSRLPFLESPMLTEPTDLLSPV